MILDQTRLDLDLLLRLQILYDVTDHLVCDTVYVRTALGGPDAVHKGHAECLVRRAVGDRNVPALIRCLVDHWVAPERLRILRQVLALDRRLVVSDLDLLAEGHRKIPDTALNQTLHSCVNVLHSEPRKVWHPRNTHKRLVLTLLDGRLLNLRHVVLEDL